MGKISRSRLVKIIAFYHEIPACLPVKAGREKGCFDLWYTFLHET